VVQLSICHVRGASCSRGLLESPLCVVPSHLGSGLAWVTSRLWQSEGITWLLALPLCGLPLGEASCHGEAREELSILPTVVAGGGVPS